MLYYADHNTWKIADFGLSAERLSRTTMSTELSRGTASYRAPELITESPTFSDRVDIWALGCILYELSVKRKAFKGDWAVREYAAMKGQLVVPLENTTELARARRPLTNLVHNMLRVDSKDRPNAQQLHAVFDVLADTGTYTSTIENDTPLLLKPLQSYSSDEDPETESRTSDE